MKISMIAAMAQNRVIGRDNQLPWRLSADLKHFKALTMGKPLIMGRKTWESIGRPLPGRTNIVLTGERDFEAPGCEVVHSIEQALQLASGHQEVMVMGGARLYAQMMDKAERLYLTLVKADVDGDVRFPEIDRTQWQETERASFQADERNEFNYEFVVLDRMPLL